MKNDTIQITPEILALISEIDEFKGAWRVLGILAPERFRALTNKGLLTRHGKGRGIWYKIP